MCALTFTAVGVICITAIIITVGICSTIEKIHRKDR